MAIAFVQNPTSAAGSFTIGVTNADTTWARGAIELRSVVPAGARVQRSLALLGVGA